MCDGEFGESVDEALKARESGFVEGVGVEVVDKRVECGEKFVMQ